MSDKPEGPDVKNCPYCGADDVSYIGTWEDSKQAVWFCPGCELNFRVVFIVPPFKVMITK